MKAYMCRNVDKSIVIDGNLEKAEWKKAEAVSLVDTVTGDLPVQETTARLLWDHEYLYAAFEYRDNYINASMTGFNDLIYDEEVVEIFLDDNCDRKTYIEVEVNPLNTVLHYGIHNKLDGSFLKFARVENNIKSAVKHIKEKETVYVEMAIPFSEFVTAPNIPPRKGDRWLMNLFRIDRPKDGKDEYSAWSHTGKISFHMPEKFGEIIFE